MNRPEDALQIAVADLLRVAALPGVQWTHIPAAGKRTPRQGARLKRMGANAGWPDFVIVSPGGLVRMLELKAAKGRLSPAQQDLQQACRDWAIPYVVVKTLGEAERTLRAWDVLRPLARAA